jgi:hypothetical protein
MNAWTPTLADALRTDGPSGADSDPARTERQLWMLDRLAEAGLDIVEAIRRQATEAADHQAGPPANSPTFTGDLALAYARASRAVRMSIALQSKLMAQRRQQTVDDATAARVAAVRDRPARRARIERIVERLAREAHEDDDEAVEQCLAEAAERLEDVDVFGDILDRPVSEAIALICRELGLEPNWPQLAEQAWARQELGGTQIGAPLAALSLSVIPETAQRLSGTQQLPEAPPSPSPPGLSRGPSPPPHARGP